ncbi:MAG: ATP-binding cassette domain-containing protein [Clostridia bacterium]
MILETHGLTKTYNGSLAINNVDIHIKEGEIYGLVGKNGSGKTTFIRLITKLILPTQGAFTLFDGAPYLRTDISGIVETPSLYLGLNAYNNLILQSQLLELKSDLAYIKRTLDLVGLSAISDDHKKVKDYSLGMKQRLGVAMAIIGKPKFLLLDEPTNGLDPQGIFDMRAILLALRDAGTTILISSHLLGELSKLATCYGFLDKGRLLKEASASEIDNYEGKCIVLQVDDAQKAQEVLTMAEVGRVKSALNKTLYIYGNKTITELVLLLSNNGINVLHATEQKGDLESYFRAITGGMR